MNSNEILNKNAKEILSRILRGESLTVIQGQYLIDKGTITDYYRNIFRKDQKALELFDEVLEKKKKETSKIRINPAEFKKIAKLYLCGKITLKEAAQRAGMHYQTFNSKLKELLVVNEDLKKLYENKQSKRADYSNINFEDLAIEMLEYGYTQQEIEEKYNLKPKTLSKKITAFKTKNQSLHRACKILAESVMEKRELNNNELDFISSVVTNYKEKNDDKER